MESTDDKFESIKFDLSKLEVASYLMIEQMDWGPLQWLSNSVLTEEQESFNNMEDLNKAYPSLWKDIRYDVYFSRDNSIISHLISADEFTDKVEGFLNQNNRNEYYVVRMLDELSRSLSWLDKLHSEMRKGNLTEINSFKNTVDKVWELRKAEGKRDLFFKKSLLFREVTYFINHFLNYLNNRQRQLGLPDIKSLVQDPAKGSDDMKELGMIKDVKDNNVSSEYLKQAEVALLLYYTNQPTDKSSLTKVCKQHGWISVQKLSDHCNRQSTNMQMTEWPLNPLETKHQIKRLSKILSYVKDENELQKVYADIKRLSAKS